MNVLLDDAIRQVDRLLELCSVANTSTTCSITSRTDPDVRAVAPAALPAILPSAVSAAPGGSKAKRDNSANKMVATPTPLDLFARAWLQVGHLQVDIGGGESRQVIAGLKKHVAKQDLEGSLVVIILNLKPAKLAGRASEAMVLAGVAPLPDDRELVHTLKPPGLSQAGDRIYLEGYTPSQNLPKVLKSDAWKEIKSGLRVVDGEARFHGHAFNHRQGDRHVASRPARWFRNKLIMSRMRHSPYSQWNILKSLGDHCQLETAPFYIEWLKCYR
eukprot:jgi/Botrbrau1/11713/Bobra.0195s0041.1